MLRGVVSMGLAGLLIVGAANARAATQPDPLEPLNRGVFQFNNWIVDHVMQPAEAWGSANLPDDVRAAALNAYSNLSEPEFILTNLFQGNFRDAFISTERIVVNTTAGLAGIYDPATRWGLVARRPEFGEAVCSLHVPPGDYLQVPLVGPANVNAGLVLGGFVAVELYVLSIASTWLAAADAVIDTSVAAALMRHSTESVAGATTDPYSLQRSQYYESLATSCGT